MKFEPDSTVVIVVDMQNGFCKPEGSLYSKKSEEAIKPINELLKTARKNNISIVYTQDIHTEKQFEDTYYYDEFKRWGEHVVEGSWESEIVDELQPKYSDHIVKKHTYDAFYKTDLEGWLEIHGIKDLLICGTLSNVCVLHTASSAGLRDYKPVVVEDSIGYIEENHKEYSLEHIDWLFGETLKKEEIEFE